MAFDGVTAPGTADGYKATFQKHHIIPENVLSNPTYLDLLGRVGLDFQDFSTNGMFLPSTDFLGAGAGLRTLAPDGFSNVVR